MKFIKRKYSRYTRNNAKHEDPLSGLANLFDAAIVLIVALFIAYMAAFQMLDFFNPESDLTIMKKNEGQWQIITKNGKEIKVRKVTDQKIGGDEGMRLGTAYQLKSGQIIYVPEEESKSVISKQ